MLFLTISNANIQFTEKNLIQRFYTTAEALPNTKWLELINKIEFAKAALDGNFKTFVIYIASLSLGSNSTNLDKEAEIVFLIVEEIKIPNKYSDFTNIFSKQKTMVLLEQIKLNKHAIKLKNNKHLSYGLIYSLEPVELETLKT